MNQRMYLLLSACILSFCLAEFPSHIFAQSPTPQVTLNYPVTIPTVGSCNSWSECHKLCEDPLNKTACYEWAVGSRILKPKSDDVVKQAMQELACTSKESCVVYCADPAHKQQCLSVGQKYNLLPDYQKRAKELIDKASTQKSNPGLTTEIAKLAAENNRKLDELSKDLSTLCTKKENAVRCQRIADGIGIQSSTPPGPGGCLSTESCKKYCNNPDNFSECNSFGMTGPNGCTNQLSCYQTCQKGGCTDTQKPTTISLDPTKPETVQVITSLSESCQRSITSISGKTVLDTVGTIKNTGVCELFNAKDTSKEPTAKDCTNYLSENSLKQFKSEDFSQYCVPLAKIAVKTGNQTNQKSSSDQNKIQQLNTTCALLESLGKTNPTYAIAAAACQKSAATISTAREDCKKPTAQRTIVKTAEDQRKYCLSVPSNLSSYQEACSQNKSLCESQGYDWYCKQNPSACSPLIEGQSMNQLALRFTNGINTQTSINAFNAINAIKTTTKNPSTEPIFVAPLQNSQNWDIPVKSTTAAPFVSWESIPYVTPTPSPKAGEVRPTTYYQPTPTYIQSVLVSPSPYSYPPTPTIAKYDSPSTTTSITPTYYYPSTTQLTPTSYTTPTYYYPSTTQISPSPTRYNTPTYYPSPTKYISPTKSVSPTQYYPSPTYMTTTIPSPTYPTANYPTYYPSPTPATNVQGISTDEIPWWDKLWNMLVSSSFNNR